MVVKADEVAGDDQDLRTGADPEKELTSDSERRRSWSLKVHAVTRQSWGMQVRLHVELARST